MRIKYLFIIVLFLSSAQASVRAQDPVPRLKDETIQNSEEVFSVGDVRGTIKRKAVYLPKPRYPREALEAGADGAVRVEVAIDAEGGVAAAKAVSGNPLLFAVSEETARKTKFRRSDGAAQETGFLIYNFALESATWLRIGYDLAVVQKAPTMRGLIVPRIAKAFQTGWTAELETLGKLAEMRRLEIEADDALPNDNKPVFVRKNVPQPNGGAVRAEMSGQIFVPRINPPTPERIALAQNLTAALQNRLAGDRANLWKLNLGANLFNAFALARNPNETRNAALLLRQSLDSAPPETTAETLAPLKDLIAIFESGRRSIEANNEINKAMSALFKVK